MTLVCSVFNENNQQHSMQLSDISYYTFFMSNGEVLENRPQVVTNLTLNLPIYLTSKQTEVIFNSVENLPALSWLYLLALTQVQIYVL